MTYLDTLKMMAEAQVRHNPDQMMFVPTERILAMIAVIEEAKNVRRIGFGYRDEWAAFDAALAALEGDK